MLALRIRRAVRRDSIEAASRGTLSQRFAEMAGYGDIMLVAVRRAQQVHDQLDRGERSSRAIASDKNLGSRSAVEPCVLAEGPRPSAQLTLFS